MLPIDDFPIEVPASTILPEVFEVHFKIPPPPLRTTLDKSPAKTCDVSMTSSPNQMYCAACKKSFSNQSTWANHLKSSKHLTNAKSMSQDKNKYKLKSVKESNSKQKLSEKKGNSNDSCQTERKSETHDAITSLRKAKGIENTNPHLAATVYYNVANRLWAQRQVQDTARSLSYLLTLLQSMSGANQSATSKSSSSPQLSSSQITQMMVMSALISARISYLFGINQDNIILLYDLALSTRWECYTEITRQIADNADKIPFWDLEIKIAHLMTQNIAPPLKKQPNFIFIMQEAAIVAGVLNLPFSKIRSYLLLNLFVSKGASSQNDYIKSVELALDLCIEHNIADLCTDVVTELLQTLPEQMRAIDSVDEPVLWRILTIIIRGWKTAIDLADTVRLFRFIALVDTILVLEQFRILPVQDILELKILRLEACRICSRTFFPEDIELYNLIEDIRSEYNKPEESENFSIINVGLKNEWLTLSESKLWLSRFRQISDDIGWIQ